MHENVFVWRMVSRTSPPTTIVGTSRSCRGKMLCRLRYQHGIAAAHGFSFFTGGPHHGPMCVKMIVWLKLSLAKSPAGEWIISLYTVCIFKKMQIVPSFPPMHLWSNLYAVLSSSCAAHTIIHYPLAYISVDHALRIVCAK